MSNNKLTLFPSEDWHKTETVESYRTAIKRGKPSAPLKRLLKANQIRGTVLDYGCGRGDDLRHLINQGFDAIGYDPHWLPYEPSTLFDTILCTYVLNVVSLDEENQILVKISDLLVPGGTAFITVRRDIRGDKRTSRGRQRETHLCFGGCVRPQGATATWHSACAWIRHNVKSLHHQRGSYEIYDFDKV